MAKFKGREFLIQRKLTVTAWLASTTYAVGVMVTTSHGTYQCITSGTSASSGTGPATTNADITDGTAHWKFLTALLGKITLAGMRSTSMKINNEQVDTTDKGSAPWRNLSAFGIQSMELSGAGIFNDDASLDIGMVDLQAGAINDYFIISGRGDSWEGQFLASGGERSGEYNGAEQYTMSFASASEVIYTPAT